MRLRLLGLAAAVGTNIVPLQDVFAQSTHSTPAPTAAACNANADPYKNYACLDDYLGNNVFDRFLNYYKLEWGQSGAPTGPDAPAQRRSDWDPAPETTPPMPFTE